MTVSVWTLIETAPPITNWTLLGDAGDTVIALASEGQLGRVVAVIGPAGSGGGGGGVSGVAMSVPTGFAVAGSPIISSGTLALSFASGYSLPTNAAQAQWDLAFGWGNHALAGYLTPAAIGVTVQAQNADLASIAAVADFDKIFYRSAPGTWAPITIGANLSFSGGVLAASGGGGGLSDGDYAGISVSGAGTVMTVNNGTITFAKMQTIATDRLVGRDTASSGAPEEITVGGGLEFTGSGGIQRSALTGDVTASAGSGSTTIANNAVSYAKLQDVSAASKLLGRGAAGGAGDPEEIAIGSGLSMSGTTLSATAAGGWTEIAATTTTGAGPWVFTSIPQSYNELAVWLNVTKDASGTNLLINLSGDNGSTWTGNIPISGSGTNRAERGNVHIPFYTRDAGWIFGGVKDALGDVSVGAVSGGTLMVTYGWRVDGGIDALRVAIFAGTLTATSIKLFGR